MNPFSSAGSRVADEAFDPWSRFVADSVPDPGPFLADQGVLEGVDHAAFHRLTRELFDRRGVYDATFGYNLARLNLDRRHPEAGYRYAIEIDEPTVLRAEFTPTTEFCPQAAALVKGSMRAWNGCSERHEYDLVRVRVHPTHHRAQPLNADLAALEEEIRETGRVPDPTTAAESASRSRTPATESSEHSETAAGTTERSEIAAGTSEHSETATDDETAEDSGVLPF